MRHRIARITVLLGAIVLVAGLASVAAAATGATKPKLKGSVTADGSSTVGPYTTAAAELFGKIHKDVKITVGISGTGGGFERFCNNETDLSDASRPMKNSEAVKCKDKSVGWRAFTVANDALTVVVNQSNTWAKCLSVEELRKIWEPGSKVDNWKDVRPGFPDQRLRLYGPGTDSGTFDYFTEAINGKSGRSRSDFTASEDDNVLVQGVAGDRGAMAYFGFSYFEENQSRLNAVQIRNPKTGQCVSPSKQGVWTNTYRPLSRPLFVYAKASSFKRLEVQEFVKFMITNQAAIAKRARFISLTPKQVKKSKVTLALALRAARK